MFLFVAGMAIQLVALLGEHATEIPCVIKFIAPAYYHANKAVRRLELDSSLLLSNSDDEGFAELSPLLAKHTAKKLGLAAPSIIHVKNVNVNGAEFIDSKIATSIHWEFKLDIPIPHNGEIADRGTDSWSFEVIQTEVDDMKSENILIFCFGLFFLGCICETVAFFLEFFEVDELEEIANCDKQNPQKTEE